MSIIGIHTKNKNQKMNKADLINEIANSTGLPKTKAAEMLNSLTTTIQNALTNGDKVTLVGFGTWETTTRQARKGRNPQSGAEINIPAKKVAKFRAGSTLANQVNS
jgi:DNA-binding protein HU-beta